MPEINKIAVALITKKCFIRLTLANILQSSQYGSVQFDDNYGMDLMSPR
jgi:hypothetical protein